jgi:hypothetical protein
MKWFMVVFILISGQPQKEMIADVPGVSPGPFDSHERCELAVDKMVEHEWRGPEGSIERASGGGWVMKTGPAWTDKELPGLKEMRIACAQIGGQ